MSEEVKIPRFDNIASLQECIQLWKDARNKLESCLSKLSDERFVEAMPDKSWSASEIAQHLAITQLRFARVIPMVLKGRFGENAGENYKADLDTIEKYFNEHRKVKNPEEVSPKEILNKEKVAELLSEAMNMLGKNTGGVAISDLKSRTLEHPMFGPLNLLDYIWSLILHELHHIYLLKIKFSL